MTKWNKVELTDKLWYGRKPAADQEPPPGWTPEQVAGVRAAQKQMEDQYGIEELASHVEDQFSRGLLRWEISAIRWVLGDDWDMLDSWLSTWALRMDPAVGSP